jgi:purine-binding chemotaxis protein CheW
MVSSAPGADPNETALSGRQLVTFGVGGTLVGVDIRQVSCLVRMVEITKVPRSSRFVEGIVNVRGQIVPVISLHRLFRAAIPSDLLSAYILVAQAGVEPVGLTLDSMTQLYEVRPEQLEPSSKSDPLSAILPWVVKHEAGILFVLDLIQLMACKDSPELAARLPEEASDPTRPASPEVLAVLRQRAALLREASVEEGEESTTFFTFALGHEKYAVAVGHVDRVLVPPVVVPVPGTPEHFAGIMNYAGEVLWVLDPKTLLALPPSLPGNDERVLVLDYGTDRFGLLIDAAYDIASFPATAMRGSLVSGEKAKGEYFAGEIYWRDELIGILDFSTCGVER